MGYIESDNGRAPVRPSKASRMTVWQRPHCMSDTELSHCIRERALAESVGCGAVGHGVDAGGVPQHTFAVEREKDAVVGTIEHRTNNPRNQGATGAADMLRSAGRPSKVVGVRTQHPTMRRGRTAQCRSRCPQSSSYEVSGAICRIEIGQPTYQSGMYVCPAGSYAGDRRDDGALYRMHPPRARKTGSVISGLHRRHLVIQTNTG